MQPIKETRNRKYIHSKRKESLYKYMNKYTNKYVMNEWMNKQITK